MRNFFLASVLLLSFAAMGQQRFNNEWIDYSKTYYKFKVGSDGLYRITGATLAAAGMGSATAEQFQLWRNGEQVPLYTSKQSGALATSDYLEFWGRMNDGKPDKELYRDPSYQYNDKWSLLTDSATYFLTINPSANNLRLQPTLNDVAGNTLPAEPYFMYTRGHYFRDQLNQGLYFLVSGDRLISSSYDIGEGWTSGDIGRGAALTETQSNLYPAVSGPAASFKIAVTGNAYNSRRYKVMLNGDSIVGNVVPYMDAAVDQSTFNASLLTSGAAAISIINLTDDCGTSSCPVDRMVVHKYELTYPRQFNFGGEKNFEFTLPASTTGNYLEVSNFNHGGTTPALYDLTNGLRYDGVISGTLVKFALKPSATSRSLVLVSEVPANVSAVTSLQTRNFINYNTAATQGDYLIISNALLFSGANGVNPVEAYRTYRTTTAGGSYNARLYLEDQLNDQFGFGIKKHPGGIRNFILYARSKYPVAPKHVFLIGRGVNYREQDYYDTYPDARVKTNLERLNLVPTFGYPASDMLLVSDLRTSTPFMSIGRLTAITPEEVTVYLEKVKEYEAAQQTPSPSVSDKAWMKNITHVIGAGDEVLDQILISYMDNYRRIVQDSLYGAKVTTFQKTSTNTVEQLNESYLTQVINEGTSLITYYGHSSATTLAFNLDDPNNYNNQGKYPMFIALGCNAGNTFDYNEGRFNSRTYLSDRYVLAPNRGAINFVASTHFGIVHYLDLWNSRAYRNFTTRLYGGSIGEVIHRTVNDVYSAISTEDFFARCNAEEIILNGDPAIKFNQQSKPDYAITPEMVTISPSFVSVADQTFKLKIKMVNLGKAVNDSIMVETKRQYPDGTTAVLRRDTIRGIRAVDSLSFNVPIDPIRDKGLNKLFVTVDANNAVEELYETNNNVASEFVVYEEEARPIYPQNFTIVNRADITLKASTANPFGVVKQYRMEIDTTEKFSSSFKVSRSLTANGGLLEFAPGIGFSDTTVYYWRVGPVDSTGSVRNWNAASFIYLPNWEVGSNQSHINQQQKSTLNKMGLDSATGRYSFNTVQHDVFIRNGIYPTTSTQNAFFYGSIDGLPMLGPGCGYDEIIFSVLDPKSMKPVENLYPGGFGQYNSNASCAEDRKYNFMYLYNSSAGRKNAMDFLDRVPAGSYVVVRSNANPYNNTYVDAWKADTAIYGAGNSLYHRLVSQGFNDLDSFNRPRAWAFVFKKDSKASFTPRSAFSEGIYDGLTLAVSTQGSDSTGAVSSPLFGPASRWKTLYWNGISEESPSTDRSVIGVLGVRNDGRTDTLFNGIDVSAQQSVDVSSINPAIYPYVQLFMNHSDGTNYTPYQLKYWRVTYVPVPEGALAPNVFVSKKDTVDVGEPMNFRVAFKNVSDAAFDSLRVKFVVTDRNNVQRVLPAPKLKPLAINDTATVQYQIDTKQLVGMNTLFFNVNPENDQPEQLLFNNFGYVNFYVRGDTLNPLMDVTFDNLHILNRDIVSAKPDIKITLKDEAKWMLLNDTAVASVQVRFPNGATRTYRYNSDTLMFIPSTGAPNTSNTASIRFRPAFLEDGDYELVVSGKDMSNNSAGTLSYRVGFQVINKPMISNMLNYPNPFTTSTAFVFTLTGSEVPQNIRIQILTVTGKIVREITKEELGTLRIGRNITDFKWDGTDQYGQKLANGVYLYRVITNEKGKSLDKYTSSDDVTDKYFNKGYGKMYLMR